MSPLLLAASLTFAVATPAPALTIWCWGDSIAFGLCHDLPPFRPSDTVENHGMGGECTSESLTRARDTIALGGVLPDVVVLELGTNDAFGVAFGSLAETPDEAADNVAAIRQLFLDAGVSHVITATTIFAACAGDRAAWLRAFRARIRSMKPWTEFRFVSHYLEADHIHPNAYGRLKLVRRVTRVIDRVTRSRRRIPPTVISRAAPPPRGRPARPPGRDDADAPRPRIVTGIGAIAAPTP